MEPRFRLPTPALAPLWVLLAAFAIQLPLALAPGYFSHDELQWAWRAQSVDFVPWWDHRETFQFRPLTFNLWMALSRAFFDSPRVFHSILVAWGSLNAALLFVVGRRFGMGARAAAIGAIGFVLTPFAAYTHGWVATIADLIWVSDALVLAWCVLRIERGWVVAVLAFLLSFEAILGKEAAAAIPVLCAVAWLLDPARRGRWTAATIGSGLAIALFLAWRAPALLHAPRDGGMQYVPSLSNVPVRWFEYQVFPPIFSLLEAHTTWMRAKPVIVAAALWIALVVALWRANRRIALAFLLGGFAALAPVLTLGVATNHYGYGFAALGALCVAAAWRWASRPGRVAIALYAGLTVLHGVAVMLAMHQVARIQSVFSPALAQLVSSQPGVVRLRPAPDAKEWIFVRLTHEIPAYHGVPVAGHVELVAAGQPADYEIRPDGSLIPVRTTLPRR